jgi:cyclophilin family peptidyl-prolyl cis-trans isomerase
MEESRMKPKLLSFFVVTILFALAGSAAARGQESATEPAENGATPPSDEKAKSDLTRADKALVAPGGPGDANAAVQAKAAFDAKFSEYKTAVREIEKMQTEFQSADAATRQKLNNQLAGQIAHAQSIVNEMVEAAVEAYRFAPNADEQITELLIAVARYDVIGRPAGPGQPGLPAKGGHPDDLYHPIDGGDRYERALPVLKLLIENNAGTPELYVWGFLAAFATNDYELASKWLQEIQKNDGLQPIQQAASRSGGEAGLMQGVLHQLSSSIEVLDQYRELWTKESQIRAAEAAADDLPRVKLTTTKGEIVVELFENEAPQSVASFLTLVKQGFYDGSPFHRVLPKFMTQGGAKDEDGQGGPGYTIRCECYRPDYRRHFRGTLSMAHAGRDTGNSQFFLTFVPTAHLNGRHTAFGRVIEGIEVLADLQRRSPQHQANPPKADRILKAEVIRDRGHEYKFEKLPDR